MMYIISAIGIIFIIMLLSIVLTTPVKKRIKKKKESLEETPVQKDWKDTSLKLEGHIHALRLKLDQAEKKETMYEKQLNLEKEKVAKLQEKIQQERQWIEKEQKAVDKSAKEIKDLKEEVIKVQDQFAKEHAMTIRLEHDLQEQKTQSADLLHVKRTLESENTVLKNKTDEQRREIAQLKGEIAELTKKKEDTSWVAKSDYQKLEGLLAQKEKELERMRRINE